jgi:hypothetical protein
MSEPSPEPKAKAIVLAGNRGLEFRNLDEMYRFCVACAASKEFKDIQTPEQALIRLQAGLELGLSPIWSLVNIMVVNGRPSVWGDALLGLVLSHPDCEDVIETIENEGTEQETSVCEVRRKGRVPVVRKFSIADVRRAGLDRKMQSVHGVYPQRMRQMRSRSWACRDAFADALRGMGIIEEQRDVTPRESVKAIEVKPLVLPDEVAPKEEERGLKRKRKRHQKVAQPPAQEPESSNAPVGFRSTDVSPEQPISEISPPDKPPEPQERKTGIPEQDEDDLPF